MWMLWLGVALVALKWAEVGPTANLSWWWTLCPLGLAFLWFEFGERLLGRDRRKADHVEWEKKRRERVAKQFEQVTNRKARKA